MSNSDIEFEADFRDLVVWALFHPSLISDIVASGFHMLPERSLTRVSWLPATLFPAAHPQYILSNNIPNLVAVVAILSAHLHPKYIKTSQYCQHVGHTRLLSRLLSLCAQRNT